MTKKKHLVELYLGYIQKRDIGVSALCRIRGTLPSGAGFAKNQKDFLQEGEKLGRRGRITKTQYGHSDQA